MTHPVFASPTYARLTKVFGPAAGAACTAGRAQFPFPFVIAWDKTQKIRSHACHELIAPHLTSIYAQAAAHYGEKRFRDLGLDLFGGCYNDRPMRGSTRRSTHAWGIAVDVDPARNQLRWGADKAVLDGPDYEAWWKIIEAHGAFSLGRKSNYDWMHFQFCQV
ncbi:M15 family metallopeptidase [Pseudanabaena phage Pan4]|nr:M15 family metallopeptidase [Pseudanabaena phage Pan4]